MAFGDTIRLIHGWTTFKDDNLRRLENVLHAMSDAEFSGFSDPIELFMPDFEKADLEGMRGIIKACQDEIDVQMQRAIGVE